MTKNTSLLLLIAVLAVVIFAGVTLNQKQTVVPQEKVSGVESVKALDTVSKMLDEEDLSQMDTELNQLSADSSGL